MSFLMNKGRSGRRSKAPGAGGFTKRSYSTTAPAPKAKPPVTTQRRASSQIQIQRPQAQATQMITKEKSDQELRTSGMISVAEVRADLEILQRQQMESKEKLQQAIALKQRRHDQLYSLEKKLGELKFQNGQKRANVHSANDILAKGQRKLLESKSHSDSEGRDLQDYDRKLQMALNVRRSVVASGRKHDRLLEELGGLLETLQRLKQNAGVEYDRIQHDLAKEKEKAETTRSMLQDEGATHSRLASQIAQTRATLREEETGLDVSLQQERAMKTELQDRDVESENESARHSKEVQLLADKTTSSKRAITDFDEKKRRLQEAIDRESQQLKDDWHSTIIIQEAEGHSVSQPPSQTAEPPILDLNSIRETLNQESKAVTDEAEAKVELTVAVESLREDYSHLQQQHVVTANKVEQETQSIAQMMETEMERKRGHAELSVQLDEIVKNCQSKTDELENITVKATTVLGGLKTQIAEAKYSADHTDGEVSLHLEQLDSVSLSLDQLKSTLSENKESNQKNLVHLEQQLLAERQREMELLGQSKAMAAQYEQRGPQLDKKTLSKHQQALKVIKQAFARHPQLVELKINYRRDLSTDEQAAVDLEDISRACKARKKAAQKRINILQEQEVERLAEQIDDENHPPAGEDSAEGGAKVKEKVCKSSQSAVKPRYLLTRFLDESSTGVATSARMQRVQSPKEMTDTDLRSSTETDDHGGGEETTSIKDKRVHWEDDQVSKSLLSPRSSVKKGDLIKDSKLEGSLKKRGSKRKGSDVLNENAGTDLTETMPNSANKKRNKDDAPDSLSPGEPVSKLERLLQQKSGRGRFGNRKTDQKMSGRSSGSSKEKRTTPIASKTVERATESSEKTRTASDRGVDSSRKGRTTKMSELKKKTSTTAVNKERNGDLAVDRQKPNKSSTSKRGPPQSSSTASGKSTQRKSKGDTVQLSDKKNAGKAKGGLGKKRAASSSTEEDRSTSKKSRSSYATPRTTKSSGSSNPGGKKQSGKRDKSKVARRSTAKSSRSLKNISFTFG